MLREYSVDGVAPGEKARHWSETVSTVYYPQSAVPRDPIRFSGRLSNWALGEVSLSRIVSGPIRYVREPRHLLIDRQERLLVTFSGRSDIRFRQEKMSIACRGNQFFIEMAHLPYVFEQLAENEIWVLRIDAPLLRWHVGNLERFVGHPFDAEHGVGALLFDVMRLAPQRLLESRGRDHARVGQSLIELLALALEGDDRVLASAESSVQAAHVARIDLYIRQNLENPDLSPALIARSCGISRRYLHGLFRASGTTVGQRIREQRLLACDRDLCRPGPKSRIADIAYRWGFSDHAQFSRQFKAYFGCTPSERRNAGAGDL
jgi:AraC-like DNA-binding protein